MIMFSMAAARHVDWAESIGARNETAATRTVAALLALGFQIMGDDPHPDPARRGRRSHGPPGRQPRRTRLQPRRNDRQAAATDGAMGAVLRDAPGRERRGRSPAAS